jgi:tRNA A-37 threonylcarbamoyl transferase component Bud32
LLEVIARGGMGIVYKARQVSLHRAVAVKMILSGQIAGTQEIQRFWQEAEAAAHLQHPNIVAIHEVGEQDGHHYFSMDFVEGKDLAALMRDGPLEVDRAVRYVKTVAEAIHYAHEKGILHRDLKPSNVLIDRYDQPRVTDFGLAKRFSTDQAAKSDSNADAATALPETREPIATATESLTLTGQVLGTPQYMPPEQALGKRESVGKVSDIYSLGGILFYLLTGRAPFTAQTLEETLHQVLTREPSSPRLLNRRVPKELETICLKCLAKEPDQRFYQTAQELAADLGRWLRHEPITARPAGIWERGVKWVRRYPVITGLAAAIIAGAFLAALTVRLSHQKSAEELARRLGSAEFDFQQENEHPGLATLAQLVRKDPANRISVERLVNAIRYRNFLLPTDPVDDKGQVSAPDGSISRNRTRHIVREPDLVSVSIRDSNGVILFTISNAHDNVIRSRTWSADGRRIVTSSADHKAKIWSADDGPHVPLLTVGHKAGLRYAELSPNGKLLVTAAATDDNTAQLWDATAREPVPIGRPMKHRSSVNTARFNSEGTLIVTASDDRTVRVWDGASAEPITVPLTFDTMVIDAFFTSDGRHVGVNLLGTNQTLTFFVASGFSLPSVTPVIQPPDRSLTAMEINSLSPQLASLARNLDLNWLALSSDRQRLATSTKSGWIRVWDSHTGLPLTDLIAVTNVVSVCFSADDQWLSAFAGQAWEAKLELHVSEGQAPPWLADLAEAVATGDFTIHTAGQTAIALARLRKQLIRHQNKDRLSEWAAEFIADETQASNSVR